MVKSRRIEPRLPCIQNDTPIISGVVYWQYITQDMTSNTPALSDHEQLNEASLPVQYRNARWQPMDETAIAQAYASVAGIEAADSFLPETVLKAVGKNAAQNTLGPVNVDPEQFASQMQWLGEEYLYPNIPKYLGKNTQICMNLTALMTNYLADAYRFPVRGLYDQSDEALPNYLRPVSTIFDRVPQYAQFADQNRYSIEDAIEVKLGDRTLFVDFNFWYGDKRHNGAVLVHEVTTREQRVQLGQKFGLWTTEFSGLDTANAAAVAEYIVPADGDTGAADYYLHNDLNPHFLMNLGSPDLLADYDANLAPNRDDPYFGERWQSFLYDHTPSGVTVQEHIKETSFGALISQGHSVKELTAYGRMYYMPNALQEIRLLTHLPEPASATESLSRM